MGRRARRWLAASVLTMLAACDTYSCRWTDDPPTYPSASHVPDRAYPTDDGAFELILRVDETWPLTVGEGSVQLEIRALQPDDDAEPSIEVLLPYARSDDRTAELEPIVVDLDTGVWRVEQLVFDAPGPWVVPVRLRQGSVEDSIELCIDVADS